jgi:hypothetical protein
LPGTDLSFTCFQGFWKNDCSASCAVNCELGCDMNTSYCTACSTSRFGFSCDYECNVGCTGCNRMTGACLTTMLMSITTYTHLIATATTTFVTESIDSNATHAATSPAPTQFSDSITPPSGATSNAPNNGTMTMSSLWTSVVVDSSNRATLLRSPFPTFAIGIIVVVVLLCMGGVTAALLCTLRRRAVAAGMYKGLM